MPHRVTDYPSAPCVKRAVDAVRDAGVKVSAIAVRPDGTIILSEATIETTGASEVESWFEENGLEKR